MLTFEVEIVDPKAKAMLDEMESKKLIKLSKHEKNGSEKWSLQRGSMKGLVLYMADDFDAPLDDFEDYLCVF